MKKTNVLLVLTRSSACCQLGPIFIQRPGELDVWYDAEGDESIEWSQIKFRSALAVRFCPEASVDETMVTAYSRILEIENSDWLAGLSSLALEHHQQLLPGLRHMMLFFDHYGCLEVIAKSVIEDKNGVPPIKV